MDYKSVVSSYHHAHYMVSHIDKDTQAHGTLAEEDAVRTNILSHTYVCLDATDLYVKDTAIIPCLFYIIGNF